MASSTELNQEIAEAHAMLGKAIEGTADRWEQRPAGAREEEWTPREVVEHVLGGDLSFAGWVARVMLGRAPEVRELTLASAQDALTVLPTIADPCEKVFSWVEDRDLTKKCEEMERLGPNFPLPANLEGVLRLVNGHLRDHAQQLDRARLQ